MQISSCLNPQRVYNKYSNEILYVPCGKCAACANSRAKFWIDRLNQESKCWKYVFSLYLDYSDEYVPTYQIVGEYLLEQQKRFFKHFTFDEVCIPLNDLNFENDYDFKYFVDRCNDHRGIPHASVRDIQNFKKRLNKWLFKHVTGKYQNYRSAIVAEYGPTTFRGHYHGMLFFNDDSVAARISEAVSSCWSFGHSTAEPPKHSRSAIAGYVAQYLNRPTHLPSIHAHRALSPFFLTSRNPPIGSLFESSEEVRKIFFDCSCERVSEKVRDGKVQICSVPLSTSFKNRLFPKCPRFSTLSDACRIELYRCLLSEEGEPFDNFEECWYHFRRKIGLFYTYGGYEPRLTDICNTWLKDFFANVTDNFTNLRPILVLYRDTKRIYYQSLIFGVPYLQYINKILEFYRVYELYRLKKFYEFQTQYTESHSFRDLMFAYPDYIHRCNCVPHWLQEHLDINSNNSFKLYKSQCELLYEESHKRAKQNGYLEKLKIRDPRLLSILNNYQYAKKCNETDEAKSDTWSERLRFVAPRRQYSQLRRGFAVSKAFVRPWW